MIVQLRIDERLIHGQIVTAWSRALSVSMIVVANDEAANNQMVTRALLMTAPGGMKVNIKTVEDTIRLLNDPRAEAIRMLLIVDNPKDAITLTKALNIKEVNVGNYLKKKSADKVKLTNYVSADPEDLELFKELIDVGEHVFSQMIPSTQSTELSEILRKATKD